MTDAVDEQVTAVVGCLLALPDDTVAGAYLYGSAVDGGLRPDSDLDFFVVSERPIQREERAGLVGRLSPISDHRTRPPTWRPVELTVVVRSDVCPWRYPPRMDFQYGEWLRSDLEAGNLDPQSELNPDLAVLITMVLLRGRVLAGPPAAQLLDPAPRGDLVRAMVSGVDGLLADLETDTRNVLLTLARIWSTVVEGGIRSKDAAAGWALRRLPEEHRSVLARARTAYLEGGEEAWGDVMAAAREHAAFVVGEIQRVERQNVISLG